jgi:hypothetical protein
MEINNEEFNVLCDWKLIVEALEENGYYNPSWQEKEFMGKIHDFERDLMEN